MCFHGRVVSFSFLNSRFNVKPSTFRTCHEFTTTESKKILTSKAYSKLYQTSKMELSAKIANGFQPLTISTISSFLVLNMPLRCKTWTGDLTKYIDYGVVKKFKQWCHDSNLCHIWISDVYLYLRQNATLLNILVSQDLFLKLKTDKKDIRQSLFTTGLRLCTNCDKNHYFSKK